MREFFICFYQHWVEREILDEDGSERKFNRGDAIRVSEEEMWRWLQRSHDDGLEIAIYEAHMKADLTK